MSFDAYPTRQHARGEEFIERLEPVIYSSPAKPDPLSVEQLAQYEAHCYLVLQGFYRSQEIDRFREEFAWLRHSLSLSTRADPVWSASRAATTSVRSFSFSILVVSSIASAGRPGYWILFGRFWAAESISINPASISSPACLARAFSGTPISRLGMPRMACLACAPWAP